MDYETRTSEPGESQASERKKDAEPRKRLSGVDVARAGAVLGMVSVHFGPNTLPDDFGGELYGVFQGRASILFVLLAGVGVSLLAKGRSGWGVRGRLILRGAMLFPLGMWLQGLDHNVLVILQFYAVYFLLAALVFTLPGWSLFAGIAASLTIGPLLYLSGFEENPRLFVEGYTTFDQSPSQIVYDLLLSGGYPVATWAAPLLFGIWLGRRNLRALSTRLAMFFGGTVAAVSAVFVSRSFAPDNVRLLFDSPRYPLDAGLGVLLSAEPHSQMPVWIVGAAGSAVAALGLCLILADALPRLFWPLVATGQMALTVYVGHILLIVTNPELVESETVSGAAFTVLTFMVVVAVICALWRYVFSRGPLEAVLAAPWWVVERLRVA